MAGDWMRRAETAEALRDGWLHSSDIGRMDEGGYAFIGCEHLAACKGPARVDVLAELPKSATGMLLKRVLREQAAASNPHSKD
ncbi:MAG: hypothetical protein NTW15_16050 [Burkholderiales bacterium]|nr:hypothetical protein [Burkholderiales bacterium]